MALLFSKAQSYTACSGTWSPSCSGNRLPQRWWLSMVFTNSWLWGLRLLQKASPSHSGDTYDPSSSKSRKYSYSGTELTCPCMFCFGSFQLSLWRPSSQGLFIKDALIQAACGLYACQVVHAVPSPQQLPLSLCSPLPSSAQRLGCPLHLCLPAPSLPPAGSVFQHRKNLLDPRLFWEGEKLCSSSHSSALHEDTDYLSTCFREVQLI